MYVASVCDFLLLVVCLLVLCHFGTCTSFSCPGGPRHRCARLVLSELVFGRQAVDSVPSLGAYRVHVRGRARSKHKGED